MVLQRGPCHYVSVPISSSLYPPRKTWSLPLNDVGVLNAVLLSRCTSAGLTCCTSSTTVYGSSTRLRQVSTQPSSGHAKLLVNRHVPSFQPSASMYVHECIFLACFLFNIYRLHLYIYPSLFLRMSGHLVWIFWASLCVFICGNVYMIPPPAPLSCIIKHFLAH